MDPFVVVRPGAGGTSEVLPIVCGIPHCGTRMPAEIEARLRATMTGQPMCDWHLAELYSGLPGMGITLVHAVYSRFIVDLNRPPDGGALYPGRYETGLVPESTFSGALIWHEPPLPGEVEEWRRRYHEPYHAALAAEIDAAVAAHGRCWFLDLHSVASHATKVHGELIHDIYLGDRDGSTNDGALTDLIQRGMEEQGQEVERNDPYKGGYNTAHYGSRTDVEALQIEMIQDCYMDQDDPRHGLEHPRFELMRSRLELVFGLLVEHVRQEIAA